MNVAILGYGTVGSGVHKIISSNNTSSLSEVHVTHILVRKGKTHRSPLMCDDIQVILQDSSVDIVVETLGGMEPAHAYIMACLKAGKHVVSANKAVIAKYMKEFHACAKEHHVNFLYEASCGGGIPWLHSLHNAMRIDDINEVKGIFNGTTNYILDHMVKDNVHFDAILAKAQELGYAERDPSADIDGIDIQNKLKISASLAFRSDILQNFPTFGIRNIHKDDIDYYATLGYSVKLMAIAVRKEDRYCLVVEPILYTKNDVEAAVSENNNMISLHGDSIGDLKFYGQGAGKFPTANAIVQDILDISLQVPAQEVCLDQCLRVDTSLIEGMYILRTSVSAHVLESLLEEYYGDRHEYYDSAYTTTKNISAYQMHQVLQKLLTIDADAFIARIHEVKV